MKLNANAFSRISPWIDQRETDIEVYTFFLVVAVLTFLSLLAIVQEKGKA